MSIRIDGTNTTANPGITGGDADTGLQFGTDEVSIVTGGTERLFINSSGNVGVATTNPGKALSVKGSSYGQAEIVGPTGSELYFVSSEGGSSNGTISYNHLSDYMNFYTAGSERMRITSTGQMRLAGAGITFNGDTAAANELDDYEEGGWTPSISNLNLGNGTITGHYTKIGNIVHLSFSLVGGSTTSFSGSMNGINNLPFTNALKSNVGYLAASNPSNNWFGWTQHYSTGTSTNFIQWITSGNIQAVGSNTVPFTWGASTEMRFNMTYRTA